MMKLVISCNSRTGKAVKNHWNCGIKRRLNSYLNRGLLEQCHNLSDDTPVLNTRGSSTLKGSEDSSKNNQFPSDFRIRLKSKQGQKETDENATTLGGISSDSACAKGFGAPSDDDQQEMVSQMDKSKSAVLALAHKKTALSPSSVGQKVCAAASSFVRSVSEEKQMSFSCPPEVLTSCANTVLSPVDSSKPTDAHFDGICSGTNDELTELHQADIADLLDMSYCESLMIIPPDSPQNSKCEHGM
jgi:myb proto-oncogene protein